MSCVSTVLDLKSTQVNPVNLVHNWKCFDTYLKLPMSSNIQQEVTELEEKRHFENEYERTRKEALERMKQAEEKKKAEGRKRAEELHKQMKELKLREEEVFRAQEKYFYFENLLLQIYFCLCFFLTGHSSKKGARGVASPTVGAGEGRRGENESREEAKEIWNGVRETLQMTYYKVRWLMSKLLNSLDLCSTRHFLIRQYRAQLKRRAQRVQEELVGLPSLLIHVIQLAWL